MKIVVSLSLSESTYEELEILSEKESRTRSKMADLLIQEALKARKKKEKSKQQ